MTTYMFILGRQPEIGLAELQAVFGNVELVLPTVALVTSNVAPNVNVLGSVRKCGTVIYDADGAPGEFLIKKFTDLPDGKITLGVSHYGRNVSAANAMKTGIFLKKKSRRSVRVLPNSEAEISDAATLGNRLGTTSNKIELLMAYVGHRLIIAELTGVQDLNAYTLRDRGRPKRDARVGMLPPKLAQTMINLAVNQEASSKSFCEEKTSLARSRKTLLDPFCGTGVVLQEAALMGTFDVFGTDIEPRMIDYTRENLDWLCRKFHVSFCSILETGDATSFNWNEFLCKNSRRKPSENLEQIDYVATETYLGQPYSSPPSAEKLRENIGTCNTIITKFLNNLHKQITPQTGICIAVPAWFISGRTHHLPLINKLTDLGYEQVRNDKLIYHRENQIVGRQILVLRKI